MFGEKEISWDTASNISLSLEDVTPAEEGVYTCVGDNGYGTMNTSLYLAVKCKCHTEALLQVAEHTVCSYMTFAFLSFNNVLK